MLHLPPNSGGGRGAFSDASPQAREEHAMIAVTLPEDMERRLSNLALKTGRTSTFYIREALQAHLEHLEEVYLTEQEAVGIRAGRPKKPWRSLLDKPTADEDFLKERPPVIDESRFLAGFE